MIKKIYEGANQGINEIKLKVLLTEHEKLNINPLIRTLMPPSEIGSITVVDQIVLLSLIRLTSPRRIIEIGTYLGYSTALLAMNSSAQIFSIDLPKVEMTRNSFDEQLVRSDGNYNDDFLRSEQNKRGEIYLDYLSSEERGRISLIKSDSTLINFQEEFEYADFIFIDGGHESSIVEKDTLNARSIVKNGVIVWHDFGSKIHNDVSSFLLGETDRKIFHVLGSLCAFEFIGELDIGHE